MNALRGSDNSRTASVTCRRQIKLADQERAIKLQLKVDLIEIR
jgi:hypothetical protein